MLLDQETIVAIATPPGRGGIGVVRLSGPAARAIAEAGLRLAGPLEPARARRAQVLGASGEVLDEAVVTWFAAPHSYTTEDVVEIAAHGAPVLLAHLVQQALGRGARLAEAGEFTRRAYLAGRLDLTQAEAVHDLVRAETLTQAKTAAAQLGGSIARAVGPVKQDLVALVAALEAGVDFAEDDLDLLAEAEIAKRLSAVEARLAPIAASFRYGRLLREGARLAMVGQPNAGKSSLFNRLLERERAIVTAQPGTTRDPIAERLAIDGIPMELVDTAGLREMEATPETEAEREGIVRSRATMAEADLVLHVVDATRLTRAGELGAEDAALQEALRGRTLLVVLNKADLVPEGGSAGAGWLRTSAVTGAGVAELRQAIGLALGAQPQVDSATITNLRQSGTLNAAMEALGRAQVGVASGTPHEFLLLDLYGALEELDSLTGTTTPDDVLRLIFQSFCIGK